MAGSLPLMQECTVSKDREMSVPCSLLALQGKGFDFGSS